MNIAFDIILPYLPAVAVVVVAGDEGGGAGEEGLDGEIVAVCHPNH